MTEIKICTVSNKFDTEEMKYLIKSTKKINIEFDIVGLNQEWSFYKKIYWFRDYLKKIENSCIVIFTDAYDVFYKDTLDIIKNKFINLNTDIVFSCEKGYSHQLKTDKIFFDNLSKNTSYKYLNSGTLMGYKDKLLEFYNDLIDKLENDKEFVLELSKITIIDKKCKPYYPQGIRIRAHANDQLIISHFLKNYGKNYKFKFDYYCDIFYVCTVNKISKLSKYISDDFMIIETQKTPSIIHVPCKKRQINILDFLFKMTI